MQVRDKLTHSYTWNNWNFKKYVIYTCKPSILGWMLNDLIVGVRHA